YVWLFQLIGRQYRLRLDRRIRRRARAPCTASARRRRAGGRLLLDQLFARRLHIGDELLVARGIDVRVRPLRIRLQLLVLARQVEEPRVRAEEDIARELLERRDRVGPLLGGLRILTVVDNLRVIRQAGADDHD